MSLYSSREPFNDDPEPYYGPWGRSAIHGGGFEGEALSFEPRPEYNRPQNNPTNPILSKLRTLNKAHWGPWIEGFMRESTRVDFPSWNRDQVDHAREVLTRLAALEKEES